MAKLNSKIEKQQTISKESPIFVVGMPRSGTTLVSSKLSAHPEISIAPESHFLNYWMQRFDPESLNTACGFSSFWDEFIQSERFQYFEIEPIQLLESISQVSQFKAKQLFSNLLKEYAQKSKKPRWGEKTPAHYAHIDELLSWYPNARIIYMVRDPRAVAASMKQVPWGGERVIAYALRWNDSIEKLKKWNDSRILMVQYEHFVESPESSLRLICSFVDESFQDQMLGKQSSPVSSSRLYSSDWANAHLSSASKPVNTDSLLRWKTSLSTKEIALIEHLCSDKMEEFSYKTSSIKLGIISVLGSNIYIVGKRLLPLVKGVIKAKEPNRNWA